MANISSEVISLAQQTEAKYGVPASVTIAQYGLESGWGSSNLAKNANNYFGITGKNHNTGASVSMNGRSWASYGSMAESFDDHGRLLTTSRYANAHGNTTDPYKYVDAIAEIYAPSSDGNNGYASTLKQIISQNNLTQYDRGGATYSSNLQAAIDSLGGTYVPSGGATYVPSGGSSGVVVVDSGPSLLELIIGKIIKFIVLVAIAFLAAVFFFNAFDMENPAAKLKRKVKTSE